jgi:hypothetical protein
MSNGTLVAAVNAPKGSLAVNWKPVPVLLMLRSENVAIPFTTPTVVVPRSVTPGGLVVSAIATDPV